MSHLPPIGQAATVRQSQQATQSNAPAKAEEGVQNDLHDVSVGIDMYCRTNNVTFASLYNCGASWFNGTLMFIPAVIGGGVSAAAGAGDGTGAEAGGGTAAVPSFI